MVADLHGLGRQRSWQKETRYQESDSYHILEVAIDPFKHRQHNRSPKHRNESKYRRTTYESIFLCIFHFSPQGDGMGT